VPSAAQLHAGDAVPRPQHDLVEQIAEHGSWPQRRDQGHVVVAVKVRMVLDHFAAQLAAALGIEPDPGQRMVAAATHAQVRQQLRSDVRHAEALRMHGSAVDRDRARFTGLERRHLAAHCTRERVAVGRQRPRERAARRHRDCVRAIAIERAADLPAVRRAVLDHDQDRALPACWQAGDVQPQPGVRREHDLAEIARHAAGEVVDAHRPVAAGRCDDDRPRGGRQRERDLVVVHRLASGEHSSAVVADVVAADIRRTQRTDRAAQLRERAHGRLVGRDLDARRRRIAVDGVDCRSRSSLRHQRRRRRRLPRTAISASTQHDDEQQRDGDRECEAHHCRRPRVAGHAVPSAARPSDLHGQAGRAPRS
jgi:hypothetical protein